MMTKQSKYTTELNYLLACKTHKLRLGETTVVFWSNKKRNCTKQHGIFSEQCSRGNWIQKRSGNGGKYFQTSLTDSGWKSISDIAYPNTQTYILGLSPNAAQASIRFWYEDTFWNILTRMANHQNNMLVGNPNKPQKIISISQVLIRLAPESKTWWKNVPASYENALFKAIVTGGQYHV